jgi:RimJ/RimL family protein N-acetyltransferase
MSFAVINDHTRAVVGSTSFLDILPQHRHAEIGITWYAHHARGTHINPASKYLLLDYAFTRMFDNRGALRITLKCNAKNEHSKRAITKLGATYEGTLRNHLVIPSGRVRDSAFYSIIATEWPAINMQLHARIARKQRGST